MLSGQGAEAAEQVRRDRKFWIAIGLYGAVAVAVWLTIGKDSVLVFGKPVEMRLIPLFVLGTFVFRTWMAREADRVRRRGEESKPHARV